MALPVDNFTTEHAVGSLTFKPPPLDGSLTQPEMVDWHMEHSPDHVWACYEGENGLATLTYSDLGRAVHRLARELLKSTGGRPTTIGMLATVDTLTYAATMLGVLRSGAKVFLISSRNSLAAVEHLLAKTECEFLICGISDIHEKRLVEGIQANNAELQLIPPFLYNQVFVSASEPFESLPKMQHPDIDTVAAIIHSSGSTSFPKPIPLTHRSLLQWTRAIWYTDRDLCNERFSLQPAPPFHGMGFMYSTSFPLVCGASVASFPPRDPPIMPTPDKVLASWKATGVTYGTGPPHNYIQWSKEPASIDFLKTLTIARCGSGPLPTAVGDFLVQQGVPLLNGWGCTEVIASLSNSAPLPLYGKDWEYINLKNYVDPIFIPQDTEGKYFEVAFRATSSCLPSVLTDKTEMIYATSDMVEFHPTRKDFFRIVGRVDDQIMLSTGEKTNPGPMESIIKAHPDVKNAVCFGRARFSNGILIQPSGRIDPTDPRAVAEFRNLIWFAVEKANAYAPRHSRVFKEMLLVASLDKPILLTPKGTVQRPATLLAYEQEINVIYTTAEAASETTFNLPDWSNNTEVLQYLSSIVSQVMATDAKSPVSIAPDSDLFDHGCDSLQATVIRNRILAGLRKGSVPVSSIPMNLLYRYATLSALATFLIDYVRSGGEKRSAAIDRVKRAAEMEREINRHVSAMKQPSGKEQRPAQDSVIITGSTGTLGCYLLQTFASSSSVKTVYAVNRPGKNVEETKSRAIAALEDRGIRLSPEVLAKVNFVEADLANPNWNISPDFYQEMLSSATIIVHNAWRLDFNLGLRAFEPNLLATRHLIDFAIASPFKHPPRVLNTSSVSAVSFTQEMPVREGKVSFAFERKIVAKLSLKSATGSNAPTGYGESKLISERILEAAASQSSLECSNIRIGQLAGSRINGAWNTSDWLPLLLQSARSCKCLPAGQAPITWLPVDVAAQVIYEIAMAPKMPLHCHLVHPNPINWRTFITWFGKRLDFKIVPQAEWVSEMTKTDIKENPALRLASYFTLRLIDPANGREALGIPILATEKTCAISPTLRKAESLGEADFQSWFGYWQKHGAVL